MTTIYSPIDGRVLRDVPAADAADVDRAFASAQEAQAIWRKIAATERGRLLIRLADLVEARASELTRLETENIGMIHRYTPGMVRRAAGTFRYFGGYADKLSGEVIPVDPAYHTYSRREPHGIVAAIVPWNAPLIFATKKMAPALAFGNACLLKPAEESPLTALLLAECIEEAGLPTGLAQILVGGVEVGSQMVADPRTDFVIFTGSHGTGKLVAAEAAKNLTPIALELGGKSPQIVFADADLEAAVNGVSDGIYGETGQACIAGSRLLVQDSIYDEFVPRLAERTRSLKVGDPFDDSVDVGPQSTSAQRDKTLRMIDNAIRDGARIEAAAALDLDERLAAGYYTTPTMFTSVSPEMEIMKEEVFGPVLVVTRFSDERHAIAIANNTQFGLAAGIWTRDVGRAHRVAAELDVGTVWMNTYSVISDLVPFGGVGLSGYGREGGSSAAALYTRVKSVWTALHE